MKQKPRSAWELGLRVAVFGLTLGPLVQLGMQTFESVAGRGDGLGINPIERLTHRTGEVALLLLLGCLAVTPLRIVFKKPKLARLRRTLGLWSFFYSTLHVLIYAFDRALSPDGTGLAEMGKDLGQRPFIAVGALAWLFLLLLAATSGKRAIAWLGPLWQTLHRLVYAAAALACIHFAWLVKAGLWNLGRPLGYGAALVVLLGIRLWFRGRPRRAVSSSVPASAESQKQEVSAVVFRM